MDLRDDPAEYAELVASSTASYAFLVGIVVVIIFSIAGLIAFTVLYEGHLLLSIRDAVIYVLLPLLVVVTIYSRTRSKKSYKGALEFHELARKTAERLGIDNGELLEKPAPPYVVIYRRGRRYIVVRKEDGVAKLIVLDPIEIKHEHSYAPVYIWKTREIMMTKKIDGRKVTWIKLWAVFPDPGIKELVHGEFDGYVAIVEPDPEKIARIAEKILGQSYSIQKQGGE